MCLKRLDVTHIDEIARLHIQVERETYQDLIPELLFNVSKIEERREIWRMSLQNKNVCTIGFYITGTYSPIGFITGGLNSQSDDEVMNLSAIYVIRKYQGLGRGKLLLASLIKLAMETGYQRLRGSIPFKNTSARDFFASAGCWERPVDFEEHGHKAVRYVEIESKSLAHLLELLQ